MTDEFRRELYHSAKGTTWTKKDHKWIRKVKIDGKTRYIYGTDNDVEKAFRASLYPSRAKQAVEEAESARQQLTKRGHNLSEKDRNMLESEIRRGQRSTIYWRKTAALKTAPLKKKTISSIISSSLKKSIKNLKRDTIEKAQHYINRKKLDSARKNASSKNGITLPDSKVKVTF